MKNKFAFYTLVLEDILIRSTTDIAKFEAGYLAHLRSKHQNVLDTVREDGELSAKSDADIGNILNEYLPQSGLVPAWEKWDNNNND